MDCSDQESVFASPTPQIIFGMAIRQNYPHSGNAV
jgi:hypothetical protein